MGEMSVGNSYIFTAWEQERQACIREDLAALSFLLLCQCSGHGIVWGYYCQVLEAVEMNKPDYVFGSFMVAISGGANILDHPHLLYLM